MPELLVEVDCPGDLIEDYDFLKAPEVWFVDLDDRSVLRFMREEEKLISSERISAGSISPLRLPGVTLRLSELF